MTPTTENAHPEIKPLVNPQRVQLAEHGRQDWVVNAEEGTTVQDVLETSYWASVAPMFQVFDKIEVRLETGEWILELIVMEVGRTYARVHVATRHNLRDASVPVREPKEPAVHEVKWLGIQRKFCVQRISDGAYLQENFKAKELAQSWLENYERTIASS